MPLDITEYNALAADGAGRIVMAGQEPSIASQQVAVGASSTQSNPMGATTRFVRLHSDVPCRIAVGVNPVAGPLSMRLAANATEYLGIAPNLRIAAIQTT